MRKAARGTRTGGAPAFGNLGIGSGLFVALAACAAEAGTPAAAELPAVVEVTSDQVQVVGTADVIAFVEDLHPTTDGSVWVLNAVEPRFVLLSAEGVVEAEVGREGGGPDEFVGPLGFGGTPSDTAWVFDRGRHSLIGVSPDGRGHSVHRLPLEPTDPARMVSFAAAIRAGTSVSATRLGDAWLLGLGDAEDSGPIALWGAELVAFDPVAGEVDAVVALDGLLGPPSAAFHGAELFLPFPLWAGCVTGDAAVYDPNGNQVIRLTRTGTRVSSTTLPPPRAVPLNAGTMAAWGYGSALEQQRRMGGPPLDSARFFRDAARALGDPDMLAGSFPEYSGMHCAEGGTVWIERFDTHGPAEGPGRVWVGVERPGSVRTVRFPAGFAPMKVRGDRVWGVIRGALDVEVIAWVSIR